MVIGILVLGYYFFPSLFNLFAKLINRGGALLSFIFVLIAKCLCWLVTIICSIKFVNYVILDYQKRKKSSS